jgi:hypothetical protein
VAWFVCFQPNKLQFEVLLTSRIFLDSLYKRFDFTRRTCTLVDFSCHLACQLI